MQLLGTMLGILLTVAGGHCQYRAAALKEGSAGPFLAARLSAHQF